ncbi:MAG: hypothetical protein A2X86_01270 [Bdellovibrionales bacterium GWA2_49_15]|nr:MAG: hypothetical protein A2X86_01270 [Bdellovibrionales bacterium GWA2_49_15]HAZ12145.1 hypothetical protein [Bdellovibrionales bacterium]
MGKIFFCSFILLFSLMWQPAFASGPKCEEALRDADLFVRDVRLTCETLKQCLVRRDTCVSDGIPNTQSKCEAVDECMGNRDTDFGDSAQCRYQWTKTADQFTCSLKRKLFASQERCPGRTLTGMGFVGMVLLQGDVIDYAVDSGFNCEAVNLHFKSRTKSLERARQKIIKFCVRGGERAQAFTTPACIESRDFKARSDGQHALPAGASNATRVNDGRDGSGSGHEGGGEESGGGGGPKATSR